MYSINQITALIGAHRCGTAERSISFLLTDSRSLAFPEETLFFALIPNIMTDTATLKSYTTVAYATS
jgi:hypothetical protein